MIADPLEEYALLGIMMLVRMDDISTTFENPSRHGSHNPRFVRAVEQCCYRLTHLIISPTVWVARSLISFIVNVMFVLGFVLFGLGMLAGVIGTLIQAFQTSALLLF